MLYTEYLECAKKHALGCSRMLSTYNGPDDLNVWLELYYLSGYIIEAITVYSVYKLGGWNDSVPIEQYDPNFVSVMHVDFYGADRKIGNTYPYRNSNGRPISGCPLDIKHHNFRQIINSRLRNEPSFNTIPYFGTLDSKDIDGDIIDLLDKWSVSVRYKSTTTASVILSKDKISRLYSTCLSIVMGVISNV